MSPGGSASTWHTLFLQTVALVTQVAEAPGLGMLQAAVFLHPCLLHTSSPPKRSKAGSAHSAAQIQAGSGLLGGDQQGQTCRKSKGEEWRAPPQHAQEGLEGVDK